MERDIVVALNSGGFDSTVLMHLLRRERGKDCEIHSLFFDYGQRSLKQESYWSKHNAEKVGAIHHVIALPKFSWTTGKFYEEGYDYKTQYVEWRNLVFMSYAFSFAESVGAKRIFLATLKSHGYKDTSENFLNAMDMLDDNIEVIAPFSEMDGKDDGLVGLAFEYGIEPNSFHSCDNPKENGEPCGKCLDCIDIAYANEELTIDTPFKAYRRYGSESKEFIDACVRNTKPWELRVLWNNDCQLNCKHCFYGFKEMHGKRMSLDKFLEVTKQAFDLGIRSIHIGGKEPLYDDSLIAYIDGVNKMRGQYEDICVSLVTNGINFPKYARRLKAAGLEKVYVSADDVVGKDTSLLRSTSEKVLLDSIEAAKESGIELEVFVNVHKRNFNRISDILQSLEEAGVKNGAYITVIKNVGNAEKNKIERLSAEEFLTVWKSLINYKPVNKDFEIGYGFGIYYSHLVETNPLLQEIKDAINGISYDGNYWVNDYLCVDPELYCSTYLEQITLTPDGYVLGCAIDVCDPEYWTNRYAGNIFSNSLEDLIRVGKEQRNALCNGIKNENRKLCCPHECNF